LPFLATNAVAVDRATEIKLTAMLEVQSYLEQFEGQEDIPAPFKRWLAQFQEVTVFEAGKNRGGGRYIGPDIDALLRKNTDWWTVVFGAAENGKPLDIVYAQLLLAAGEADRSIAWSRLSLLRPGLRDAHLDGHIETVKLCREAKAPADALVKKGILLHDRQDFAGAVRAYDEALALWPKHALAHYEKGFSLRLAALHRAGKSLPADGELAISAPGEGEQVPANAAASYARARECFPFNFMYYQGEMPGIVIEKIATGMPKYDELEGDASLVPDDATLTDLIEMCGAIGAHDYALLLLRAKTERAGAVTEADFRAMKRNLSVLVGGKAAAEIMQDVAVGETDASQAAP
jgi:tetratricopeptide (TPR) repeat protein